MVSMAAMSWRRLVLLGLASSRPIAWMLIYRAGAQLFIECGFIAIDCIEALQHGINYRKSMHLWGLTGKIRQIGNYWLEKCCDAARKQ